MFTNGSRYMSKRCLHLEVLYAHACMISRPSGLLYMERFPSDLHKPWPGTRLPMQITSCELLASDDNQNISTIL